MVDVESTLTSRMARQSSLPTYEEAVNQYTIRDPNCNINRLLTVPSERNLTQIQSTIYIEQNISCNPPVYADTNCNQPIDGNTQDKSWKVSCGNVT